MFPEDLFTFVLEQLADEIAARETPPAKPLNTDSFIARSVMQKAIRRGMTDLALSAAATLISTDRRVLWRRLLVTALEDLGIGEVDLLARIVAAFRDRAWRAEVGGEWRVVAHLVEQACSGTRCQSANDLQNIALNDPRLDSFKTSLCEATLADLLHITCDDRRPVEHRAVAVLMALGEDAGPASPTHIPPDPDAILAAFANADRHSHVAVIYAEAHRQSRLALAPLSLCLWATSRLQALAQSDDRLPPVTWLGEIPSYSLDQYTRSGKAAISLFAYSSRPWRAFAERWHIGRTDWTKAAGELLFRAEGAVVTNRRNWNLGNRLFARSSTLACFMPESAVPEGKALMVRELPSIYSARAQALSARSIF